jgi:putative tricarboxylic transport membrane protein
MENRSVVSQSTLTSLALLLIGVCAMAASMYIPRDLDGGLGARVFPMMSSGALILLGILGILAGLKEPTKKPKEEEGGNLLLQITLLLALSFFYVWLISKLGYLVSTALVSPLILMLFGIRNPLSLLIAAIVCPAVYHAIFFMGLGVYPPYGEWFDLLDLFQK